MRKLLMLAIAVVAFAGFAAAPASADRLDPNPTFPHDDLDPGNWVAVGATDVMTGLPCGEGMCPLDGGESFDWRLFNWSQSWGAWDLGTCNTKAVGEFDAVGAVTVTDLPDACSTFSNTPALSLSGLSWSGQTCLHASTGEAWVRLWVQLRRNGVDYPGEMFGRVEAGGVDFGGALINTVESTSSQTSNYPNTTEFPLASELGFEGRVDDNQEPVPCSWPELAA